VHNRFATEGPELDRQVELPTGAKPSSEATVLRVKPWLRGMMLQGGGCAPFRRAKCVPRIAEAVESSCEGSASYSACVAAAGLMPRRFVRLALHGHEQSMGDGLVGYAHPITSEQLMSKLGAAHFD
jgi:hypothetical protein